MIKILKVLKFKKSITFKSIRREEIFVGEFVKNIILIALKDLDKMNAHESIFYNSEKFQ